METNIQGQKYGRLITVRQTDIKTKFDGYKWECKCDCGNVVLVPYRSLIKGNTKSCGCIHRELMPGIQKQYVHLAHEAYERSRIDGVAMINYNKKRAANNTTGYKGVQAYNTKEGIKYKAKLTVAGKHHHIFGFETAEDAYYNGRLVLEDEHLPKIDK